MKVHIYYPIKEGPWGGGNQFLKALRKQFIKDKKYSESPDSADIILFNSFPSEEIFRFRRLYNWKKQGKIIIHRIDGPISIIRSSKPFIDRLIFFANNLLADATVFQSPWSREKNIELGYKENIPDITIINAPDSDIFYFEERKNKEKNKVSLVATSWSSNMRKGFDIYKYIDENLDFNKFEMKFIGNSPIRFKNIEMIKPVESKKMVEYLKNSDIFITASKTDPCSNSLIEALHCGLPAVAKNDGGHTYIVGSAGEFFESKDDIISAINKVSNNIDYYKKNINISNIRDISNKYFVFMKGINCNHKKRFSRVSLELLIIFSYTYKIYRKLHSYLNK